VSSSADPSVYVSQHPWGDCLTGLPAADSSATAHMEEQLRLAQWEASTAAGLMDILERAENRGGLAQGCASLVNDFQKLVGCKQVALGVCGRHPESFRILAISGMATVDRRAQSARDIETVLAEAVLRRELTVWPLAEDAPRHATLGHQKLSTQADDTAVVSSPLRTAKGKTAAAWLFMGAMDFAKNPRNLGLIRASEPRVAACLELMRRAELNRLRRWYERLSEKRRHVLKKFLPIALGMIFLALCIPCPYKISCKCRLQPIVRRFVAAPFEGILDKSLVEPGDVVGKDQVLAMMDAREIRLAISETTAELKRSEVKRNVQLAKQDQGAAQMAALEKERLDLKLELLRSRNKKLEVKSPIRGIVLRGDQKRAEGMPVTLGQNLFEVAPLDKMVVEVAIPERDITEAKTGQVVSVKLDAYPGRYIEGTLVRIHPRTEEWDADYVFVGEILIDNPNELLHPGMHGRATVYAARHALYWNLFHKLWENLLSFFGC
jgi:RND family efflux transporter MFP subunit